MLEGRTLQQSIIIVPTAVTLISVESVSGNRCWAKGKQKTVCIGGNQEGIVQRVLRELGVSSHQAQN